MKNQSGIFVWVIDKLVIGRNNICQNRRSLNYFLFNYEALFV